jgi:hypothetical protein
VLKAGLATRMARSPRFLRALRQPLRHPGRVIEKSTMALYIRPALIPTLLMYLRRLLVALPARVERASTGFEGRRSVRLSYESRDTGGEIRTHNDRGLSAVCLPDCTTPA